MLDPIYIDGTYVLNVHHVIFRGPLKLAGVQNAIVTGSVHISRAGAEERHRVTWGL